MPLKSAQVWQLLTEKQADFQASDQAALKVLQQYHQALSITSRQTAQTLTAALSEFDAVGATPIEPLGHHPNWVIPFEMSWQNREQSLDWVRQQLTGIPSFAVDGSQIFPTKDLSLPVALIQIGWFENPHLPEGNYEKDVRLDVMTPAELQDSEYQRPADRQVNMRRFQMETECLIDYMGRNSGDSERLVFLDGSLVATFAEVFDPECRHFYVDCLLELLRASEQHQVPLVAFIDSSSSGDLARLLQLLHPLPPAPTLTDASLLTSFMEWGDRTPLFRCQRGGQDTQKGILHYYQEQADQIGFIYLKTNDGPPARLEIPLWVYEAGFLDRVIDWVRGEIVIGSGYPYAIETADQTAVLQAADRQSFFQILQEWAQQSDLRVRFSRKMISKAHRR
jgi:NurA domain